MTKEYHGSCHCGAVTFKAEADVDQCIRCNCSICGRSGAVLTFVPRDKFHVTKGEDNLTDYQFNKMIIHHLFCQTCGIRPFGYGKGPDGSEMCAVNVGCLEGVDVHLLDPQKYDGKSV